MASQPSHRTSHALSLVVLALAVATLAGTAGSLAVSDDGADDRLELLRTMAELDRAYIPALWWTGQKDQPKAGAAMDRLRAVWMGIEPILAESPLLDEESSAELGGVARSVTKASSILEGVEEGGDLHGAHEALEGVRLRMLELRRRNGLPYFLDLLTEYHEAMEAIVLAAAAGDDDDVARVRELMPRARTLWEAAEGHPFDNQVFRLQPHELRRRQQAMAATTEALEALETALDAADGEENRKRILEAARSIKPPFAHLMLLFGGLHPGAMTGSHPASATGSGNV